MDLIESGFRSLIRGEVRHRLHGVWIRGEVPPGGAVLALNHHSWWDGYVIGEVCWSFGLKPHVLMDDTNLERLVFFRRLGVLGAHELRPAVRLAKSGSLLWIFPEGGMGSPGELHPLRPGAQWLARAAGVPLVPVALRVVMRGNPRPEAFLRFGRPTLNLDVDLNAEVRALDADIRAFDPERPLPGYLRLTRKGRAVSAVKLDLPTRLLTSLIRRGLL